MSKRLFALLSVLVLASMMLAACGGTKTAAYTCTDPLGCVKIGPTEPIHIAYWGVLSGADASLGEDSKRGVEIAIDDKGGKVLGHDVLLTTEDGGCTPEGGATAAPVARMKPLAVLPHSPRPV
jgi:branched-chain amino acid transport system substrate-binding protein